MMKGLNKYDRNGECFTYGKKVEQVLFDLFSSKGYEVKKSTALQDMKLHADFFFKGKCGTWYTIDVKGMRKLNRRDSERQDEWTAIEFQNAWGNVGWTVKGAFMIAFERKNDFILIKRTDLLDFVNERVDRTTFASQASLAKYIIYRRPSRQDLMSFIRLEDLPKDKIKIWKKN
jgi:hypothetical protein